MLLRRSFWVFSVAVILCISCKKQINNAGSGVLGSQNILNGITIDTFDLITYTVQEDSIITDNAANVVLGSYTDPKLGSFDAFKKHSSNVLHGIIFASGSMDNAAKCEYAPYVP